MHQSKQQCRKSTTSRPDGEHLPERYKRYCMARRNDDKDAIISLSAHAQEISLRNREVLQKWFYGNSERGKWKMNVSKVVEGTNFPSIYDSAWFTRKWIVQEALLASPAGSLLCLEDARLGGL